MKKSIDEVVDTTTLQDMIDDYERMRKPDQTLQKENCKWKEKIYLDYSATTPTKKEVVDEMIPYFTEQFGNPSSIHQFGRANKNVITQAREAVAKTINAKTEEIYLLLVELSQTTGRLLV